MFYCIYSNYLHIRRIRSIADFKKYKNKITKLRVWRNHQSSNSLFGIIAFNFFNGTQDSYSIFQSKHVSQAKKLRKDSKFPGYIKRRKKRNEISHDHKLPVMS